MAAKDKKAPWDPYETSHKREFFYRPCSNTEFTLPEASNTFRDCYSPSGPVGPSGYREDFCWKPVSKPECIRTGSASGQRRNNPHPSQGFLAWRLPKGALPCSVGGSRRTPRSGPPSEEQIRRALTEQYCSTYRTDFLGLPQPDHVASYGEAWPVPPRSGQPALRRTRAEMGDGCCRPQLEDQLQDSWGAVACAGSAPHRVHCRGIVPVAVQRHVRDLRHVSEPTTYGTFFGRQESGVPYALKSLQPQELQRLCKVLPEKDAEVMKSLMSKVTGGKDEGRERRLPVVTMPASPPQWISSWPGPH